MNKLYFKYGVMGSSKTAQALMTKFNYEEKGSKVWLIKPATDVRDGLQLLRSRIGLEANAFVVPPEMDLKEMFSVLQMDGAVYDVIIADEAQFFTEKQIWQQLFASMSSTCFHICRSRREQPEDRQTSPFRFHRTVR